MRLARLVAAGFGSGFVPGAPGTAGALLGVLLGIPLLMAPPGVLALATMVVSLLGLWAIRAARIDGDPGWVVIDEIAGQMIPMLALTQLSIPGVLLCFALFRLFDIWKPGPVGWADKRHDEFGVMGDDIIAGALAWVIVLALHLVSPW